MAAIISVDRITIGDGKRGEITAKIQTMFFEITKGERPAPGPWLTYVREQEERAAGKPSRKTSDNSRVPKSQTDDTARPAEMVATAAL